MAHLDHKLVRRNALAVAAALVVLLVAAPRLARLSEVDSSPRPSVSVPEPPPDPPPAASAAVAPAVVAPAIDRADRELTREGRSQCAGGVLVALPDLASEDGKFDLVVHFHGGAEIVTQSFASVKLNAAVVVFNIGVAATDYAQFFGYRPRWTDVLEQAQILLRARHLRDASIRRIALSAFSAGVGAVERVLQVPGDLAAIDGVILLDGMHTSYRDGHQLDLARIDPFASFARSALAGDKLFVVTHSDLVTFKYASTHETTDALLAMLGLERQPGGETPVMPDLPAMGGAEMRKSLLPLEPRSHVEKGGLFVYGYAGDRAEHHLSHLMEMASTALPHLAERWRSKPPR